MLIDSKQTATKAVKLSFGKKGSCFINFLTFFFFFFFAMKSLKCLKLKSLL